MNEETYSPREKIPDNMRVLTLQAYERLTGELNGVFKGNSVHIDDTARDAIIAEIINGFEFVTLEGDVNVHFRITRAADSITITGIYSYRNRKKPYANDSHEQQIAHLDVTRDATEQEVTLRNKSESQLRTMARLYLGINPANAAERNRYLAGEVLNPAPQTHAAEIGTAA